jgi:hypothetical protein
LSAVSQEDFDPEVIMVAFEQRLGWSNEIRLVNWLRGNRNMVSQRTGVDPYSVSIDNISFMMVASVRFS